MLEGNVTKAGVESLEIFIVNWIFCIDCHRHLYKINIGTYGVFLKSNQNYSEKFLQEFWKTELKIPHNDFKYPHHSLNIWILIIFGFLWVC